MPNNVFRINTRSALLQPVHFDALNTSFPYSCFNSLFCRPKSPSHDRAPRDPAKSANLPFGNSPTCDLADMPDSPNPASSAALHYHSAMSRFMRRSLSAIIFLGFLAPLFAHAPIAPAPPAAAQPTPPQLDRVLSSQSRARTIAQVAVSPDGKRVAWLDA